MSKLSGSVGLEFGLYFLASPLLGINPLLREIQYHKKDYRTHQALDFRQGKTRRDKARQGETG